MREHHAFDLFEVPASVARLFPENDRCEEEDCRSVGGADVDVWRVVLSRVEVKSIGSDLKQRWHADLAKVSTGRDHRSDRFATTYPDDWQVSRG